MTKKGIFTLLFITLWACLNTAHAQYKYYVKDSKFAMRYNVDLGLWDTHSLKSDVEGLDVSSKHANIGVDFGYLFAEKGNNLYGIFTGVNLGNSFFNSKLNCPDYYFTTDQDVDEDTYERHYQNLNMKQEIWTKDITIPLYIDMTMPIYKRLCFYADLGLKFNVNIYKKVESASGNAYVFGVYPQYDNMIMDETWGFNGFGNTVFSDSESDNNVKVNTLTTDFFAGLGLRFIHPSEQHLVWELGVNYSAQLNNTFKADTGDKLVYNTIDTGNNTEHMCSLTNILNKSKRNALLLHISVMMKF
ncbi:MAG: hypothetical protein K6E54_08020 [Bacteroidaceae bacterium]|nr:hypothetical protein [Bacteroidaceae bacterium]